MNLLSASVGFPRRLRDARIIKGIKNTIAIQLTKRGNKIIQTGGQTIPNRRSSPELAVQNDQNQKNEYPDNGGGRKSLLVHPTRRKNQPDSFVPERRERTHFQIIFFNVPDALSILLSA
jgi:hypothetical protein